ncbi:tumor necrosis factor receptor superfamily member 18 [Rhynchocyon petersi]
MSALAAWTVATLLCVLSPGQGSAASWNCDSGLMAGTGDGALCCRTCYKGACFIAKIVSTLPTDLWLQRSVLRKIEFGFACVDCGPGTFSDGTDGLCKPRADCSKLGFFTMFPGNKTHNAVCSPGLPPDPHYLLTIFLIIMVTCILVLAVVLLGVHIWALRRPHMCQRGTLQPLEMPPPEDACSYQLPEEERGEQLAEEKSQQESLCV